uniref:BHLH domain-containing protein n=1 Tax=Meloidogyne incognita TaxID=6306 RepID=A0A914LSD1_MELIC
MPTDSKKPLTEQQKIKALTRAERRRLRRSTPKYRSLHASRERIRVEAFNKAFQQVRELLPTKTVYNNGKNVQTKQQRKMSKIETLRSAIEYLRYLEFMLIN